MFPGIKTIGFWICFHIIFLMVPKRKSTMDPNPFCEGCGKDKGMFLKVLVLEGFLVVPKKKRFCCGGSKPKTKNKQCFHPWAQIWISMGMFQPKNIISNWMYIFWKTACITSGLCIIPGLIKKTYPCTAMHMYIQVLKKVFWQPALPAWAMPLAGRAMPDWVVGCKLGSRIWPNWVYKVYVLILAWLTLFPIGIYGIAKELKVD